jgi:DNA-binding GntR family transcriptional regulator
MLKRLPVVTLRERVLETLSDAILTGVLKPGERLVERELCQQLGASSTVIREALVELETEGYVTKRTNAATFVTSLSAEEIRNILDLRMLLEPHAAGLAAKNASAEEIAKLQAAYKELVRVSRAGDEKAYVRADLRLHEQIWALSGNEFLVAALRRALFPFFAYVGMLIMAQHSIDIEADAVRHDAVLQPIYNRKPGKARKAMEAAIRVWTGETSDRVLAKRSTAGQGN